MQAMGLTSVVVKMMLQHQLKGRGLHNKLWQQLTLFGSQYSHWKKEIQCRLKLLNLLAKYAPTIPP